MKKKRSTSLLLFLLFMTVSFGGFGKEKGVLERDQIDYTKPDPARMAIDNEPINGKTTGKFNLSRKVNNQSGTATVSRIPQTVDKFKELREKIGKTPQGAIALYYVAMEMFRVDQPVGEECLALVSSNSLRDHTNTKKISNSNRILLQERLTDQAAEGIYAPWLSMAYWQGAKPDGKNNRYNVTAPYTLKVKVNNGVDYVTPSFGGKVMHLLIVTPNTKSGHLPVAVQQPDPYDDDDDGYFKIYNNAALMTTSGIYAPRENRR